jgi:hypothetical protein
MPPKRRDSPIPARVRSAAASPTHAGLRRIPGLAAAVSLAAGLPRTALAGTSGWQAACARIAAADRHGPPSPLRLVGVREGRRAVGVALAPGACLSGFAAAVAASRSVPLLIHGACPPPVAKAAGIRFRIRRRWPGPPEVSARMEALASRIVAGFATACVPSGGDPAWHAALAYARVDASGERVAEALVILDPSPLAARILPLPPGTPTGGADGRPHAEIIRAAVSASLAGPAPDPSREPTLGTLPPPRSILRALGEDLPEGASEDTFDYRIRWVLSLSQRAAMAAFRRTFPEPMSALCGLLNKGFDRPGSAASLVEARLGWTTEDHRRLLQAVRQVPWLVDYAGMPEVCEAARSGSPLEAVVRAATSEPGPLHPKVVRSFRSTWRMRRTSGPVSALAISCRALDALFRSNPHHPVLSPAETRHAVAALVDLGLQGEDPRAGMALLLALRGPDGRIGPPPPHFRDYLRWFSQALGRILGTHRERGLTDEAINTLAVQLACPPHRRASGLRSAVEAWHAVAQGNARRHADLMFRFRAELQASADAEIAAIRPAPASAPPHVLADRAVVVGVEVRPLLTSADLLEEGAALGHCVGGYDWALESGHCILFGLSSPEGRSTAEVRPGGGPQGLRLLVAQHRGVRNGEPPEGHAGALAAVLSGVAEDALAALAAEMETRARVERRMRALNMERLTPEQREGLADLLMEQLRPFLSGPERNLSRADWVGMAAARAAALVAV